MNSGYLHPWGPFSMLTPVQAKLAELEKRLAALEKGAACWGLKRLKPWWLDAPVEMVVLTGWYMIRTSNSNPHLRRHRQHSRYPSDQLYSWKILKRLRLWWLWRFPAYRQGSSPCQMQYFGFDGRAQLRVFMSSVLAYDGSLPEGNRPWLAII